MSRAVEDVVKTVVLAKIDPETLLPISQSISFSETASTEFRLMEIPVEIADDLEKASSIFYSSSLCYSLLVNYATWK